MWAELNSEDNRQLRTLLVVSSVVFLVVLYFYWPSGGSQPPRQLPTRHKTKGTLTYNGQPAVGASVTFWPLPLKPNDWQAIKPKAIVAADGTFEPNSYDINDGAVQGEYAVTARWTGEEGGQGPDLFKGKYSDPNTPLAKVTITEGENTLPPIALTGPNLTAAAPAGNTAPVQKRGANEGARSSRGPRGPGARRPTQK